MTTIEILQGIKNWITTKLSKVVSVTSQTFTDAEKKQARANLGLGNGDIDNEPTAGSDNLVKSGGVFAEQSGLKAKFGNNYNIPVTASVALNDRIDMIIDANTPFVVSFKSNNCINASGITVRFYDSNNNVVITQIMSDNTDYSLESNADISYAQLIKGASGVTNTGTISFHIFADSELAPKDYVNPALDSIYDNETVVTEVEETGKYVKTNGNTTDNSAYAITKDITLKKGETIIVNCQAGTTISVISEHLYGIYNIPLVLGLDSSNIKEYIYTSDADKSIRISYRTASEPMVKIVRDNIYINSVNIPICKDLLSQSSENIDNYVIERFNVLDEESDSFISDNGVKGSNANYCISKPVFLNKGDSIHIYTVASDSVSVLAKDNGDNTYTSILVGQNGISMIEYQHTATSNEKVLISHFKGSRVVVILYKVVQNLINNATGANCDTDIAVTDMFAGYFVRARGDRSSSSSYNITNPITLRKGDVINVKTKASSSAAAIAKVLYPYKYYKTVMVGAGSSSELTYTWTADEDCNVAISHLNTDGYMPTVTINTAKLSVIIKSDFDNINLSLYDTDICRIPKKVLCIGDSVTAGSVIDYPLKPIKSDVESMAYPSYLGKLNNYTVCENAGVSGYTPKQWWDNKQSEYNFEDYQVVLIEFGYNDGLTDTSGDVDTDITPYNDWRDYADTIVGCYGKIIGKIQEVNPKAFIMLLISPLLDEVHGGSESVIIELADYFHIPYCDLSDKSYIDLNNPIYHGLPSSGQTDDDRDHIHFRPVGYLAKAMLINKFLAKELTNRQENTNKMLYLLNSN